MRKIIYVVCCFLLASITSCDEEKLDVINYGSISGKVLDGVTYLPVQGALVTTTPASISLLTDAEGKFRHSKIKRRRGCCKLEKEGLFE